MTQTRFYPKKNDKKRDLRVARKNRQSERNASTMAWLEEIQ